MTQHERVRILKAGARRRRACIPENDDESVEDVEADADVATQAVSDHLEQHLDSEEPAEEQVAVLEDLRQLLRLHNHRRQAIQQTDIISGVIRIWR